MKAAYNTKKRGILRFIVFPEKDGDYCAVCLELNLIEYGKDPKELAESIQEAAKSMVKGIIKHKLPDDDLNQYAPLKYWKMAEGASRIKPRQPTNPVFFNLIQRPYPFSRHAQN